MRGVQKACSHQKKPLFRKGQAFLYRPISQVFWAGGRLAAQRSSRFRFRDAPPGQGPWGVPPQRAVAGKKKGSPLSAFHDFRGEGPAFREKTPLLGPKRPQNRSKTRRLSLLSKSKTRALHFASRAAGADQAAWRLAEFSISYRGAREPLSACSFGTVPLGEFGQPLTTPKDSGRFCPLCKKGKPTWFPRRRI